MCDWNPIDIYFARGLTPLRPFIQQAYQVYTHAFVGKGIRGSMWSRIAWVRGKCNHRHALSLEAQAI
jgi:hypothetical protein